MSACPGADPGPDGLCRGCGRPTGVYADHGVGHRRGRWREKLPTPAERRAHRSRAASRRALLAAGRKRAAALRAVDPEGPTCECGVAIAVHPSLPRPLPWAHGRPCGKTSLDRGHGWDGREMPVHTAAEVARWQASHHRSRNAFGGALGR